MATITRRTGDSPTPSESISATQNEANTRSVQKTDAAPSPRDVAEESAAIYPDTFATDPTPEQIATEAYFIYCERGCGEGKDVDDWLEAERRLSARMGGDGSRNDR